MESEVWFWSLESGTPISTTIGSLPGEITKASFTPDGRILAVYSDETQSVTLYDVDGLPAVAACPPIEVGKGYAGVGLALANPGQAIAGVEQALAYGSWKTVDLWEIAFGPENAYITMTLDSPAEYPQSGISATAFSSDGRYVAAARDRRSGNGSPPSNPVLPRLSR